MMADSVAEPAAAWTSPSTKSDAAETPAPAAGEGTATDKGASRSAETVARETAQARAEFHRAAARSENAPVQTGRPIGRSQALQAFFLANTGRGLLPAGENSGVLSPHLKSEES